MNMLFASTSLSIPFEPSAYQSAVFEWVATGTGSAILVAVAGSGKSTTIQECLPIIPANKTAHVFVFSADIAEDWKRRLVKLADRYGRTFNNISSSTFHSKGLGAVMKRLGLRFDQMKIESSKCRKILKENLTPAEYEVYGDFVCKLVGLAKGEGIGALVPDVEERWYALISHHDLTLDTDEVVDDFGEVIEVTEARAVNLARRLLTASCEHAKRGWIDFDDQLYLVCKWNLKLWQNDFVFVDEAQDTNPVRRALAKLALKPGGRLLAVGDPCQAIFGFTGASHDALDLIKAEFNAIELPLTVSYRCPRAVVRKAQEIVSHIEAAPTAIEGSVTTLDINDALKVLTEKDAILCRQTAPLVNLAFGLIARGRACNILGKEIGEGLIKLVKSMKAGPLDPTTPPNGRSLLEKLEAFREREVAKHTAKGEEQKAGTVEDKVACIMTVIDNLPENARNVASVVYRLEKMFSDDRGTLTLATEHKSKGKEWPNVAILEPELSPSKWARQEHQVQQEYHLMYVAWTRAMENLMFLEGALK